MAQIFDLAAYRRNPEQEWIKLLIESVDYLVGEWESSSKRNILNEFFKKMVSRSSELNYTTDLNAIGNLEREYALATVAYSPFSLSSIQAGWIVAFKFKDRPVHTPELVSEAQARCFSLLLFLRLQAYFPAALEQISKKRPE